MANGYQNRSVSAFEDFTSDMENVFDSLLGKTVGSALRTSSGQKFVPALYISENVQAFEVHVDLPGVKSENVKVEMHEGKLTISGKRESLHEETEKNFHRVERSSGTFYRTLSIPSEVDVDNIDASFEDGVLKVVLPKTAKQQPKAIQIRTGA